MLVSSEKFHDCRYGIIIMVTKTKERTNEMDNQQAFMEELLHEFNLREVVVETIREKLDEIVFNPDAIKKVEFAEDHITVIWKDNTDTTVKEKDKTKGLALCIVKKLCGNNESYRKIFGWWIPECQYAESSNLLPVPEKS